MSEVEDITVDTTDQDIIQNVVEALQAVTIKGAAVFDEVSVIESAEAFTYANDPLKGACAGVLGVRSRRRLGGDNSQAWVAMLPCDVVVRINKPQEVSGSQIAGLDELNRLTDIVRQALLVDPSRGGKAHNVMFEGKLIPMTSIEGEPRPIRAKSKTAGQAFFGMQIPIVVGYSIAG